MRSGFSLNNKKNNNNCTVLYLVRDTYCTVDTLHFAAFPRHCIIAYDTEYFYYFEVVDIKINQQLTVSVATLFAYPVPMPSHQTDRYLFAFFFHPSTYNLHYHPARYEDPNLQFTVPRLPLRVILAQLQTITP